MTQAKTATSQQVEMRLDGRTGESAMAILKIAHLGHPVLRRKAAEVPVEEIRTAAFQRFCDDLLESMDAADGAGLAAPQVHVSKRVVVFVLGDGDPIFLINPVITPLSEEKVTGYEGCLSVPGMRGMVARAKSVSVEALDRKGRSIQFQAHGWSARVVQHECDHLDGVVYVDRADPKSLAFMPEYRRFGPLIAPDPDEEAELDDEDLEEDDT